MKGLTTTPVAISISGNTLATVGSTYGVLVSTYVAIAAVAVEGYRRHYTQSHGRKLNTLSHVQHNYTSSSLRVCCSSPSRNYTSVNLWVWNNVKLEAVTTLRLRMARHASRWTPPNCKTQSTFLHTPLAVLRRIRDHIRIIRFESASTCR